MEYKKTLNMTKSGFPMRAGLPVREPDMLKQWKELDVYNEMLKKNEGKPLFNLHDGPPFSNGNIHMGHALNKAIKDFITRSYAMRGYYTPYVPGWDNHGMPIESAIIKEQKLNHKEMSVADFRSACEDYAKKYRIYGVLRCLQAYGNNHTKISNLGNGYCLRGLLRIKEDVFFGQRSGAVRRHGKGKAHKLYRILHRGGKGLYLARMVRL